MSDQYLTQTSSIGAWSNYKITIGNDPQNRAGSFLPANLTKLFFTVPFNIQD